MGGIAMRAPILATIFLIVAFATLAMPGSGNFIGEILILLGLFKTKMVFSIIAFTGVLMASVYMLRAFIRTMHNRVGPEVQSRELRWRDALVLVPFLGVIFLFALYPQLELSRAQTYVTSQIAPAVTTAAPPSSTPVANR
jgi:NADH-quinone oxidoreductase subunit M